VLGYAHYLRQSHRVIHLYTDVKLPGWTSKLPGPRFVSHNRGRLLPSAAPPSLNLDSISSESERTLPGAFRVIPWGHWHWPLVVSTPERAILELLDELTTRETFHDVDMLMEGLVDISP